MLMPYTRSLRRRFAASLMDLCLILVVAWVFSLPFAGPLSSSVRGGLGIYNETQCGKMPTYKPDSTQLLLDNWSKSIVCETISDGFFVSRSLVLQQKIPFVRFSQLELGTFYSVSVEVDNRNVIAKTTNVTDMFVLFMVLFFGAMESVVGKTPGKWFFGLKVLSFDGNSPNLVQGLGRNTVKYLAFFVIFLISAISNVFFGGHWILLVAGKGNVIDADQIPVRLMTVSLLFFFLLLLAIQSSIFLPWKNIGRALYDRLARTIVVNELRLYPAP